MADTTYHAAVAIIPAYNEEAGLGAVLEVVTSYGRFSEIIVVDDGSTDRTSEIALRYPVRLIRHLDNRGKGAAMESGVRSSHAPVIFFCDADMRGFSHDVLDRILDPVLRGETDMVIAMRNWRMYYAEFILAFVPVLGGQRALRRSLWKKVPMQYKERFMIETALNFYAKHWGSGYRYIVCPTLSQTIKEVKYGVVTGFIARIRMCVDVISAQLQLMAFESPKVRALARGWR